MFMLMHDITCYELCGVVISLQFADVKEGIPPESFCAIPS